MERVTAFKDELHSLRTNRPTAKLVEDIKAEYYNEHTPIKHLASISINPPRDIVISVWDAQAVLAVIKAIEASGLGVGVSAEGTTVRVHLPELSEERRQDLVKVVKRMAEDVRIQVRRLREEMNKKVEGAEKEKKISEDQKFKLKEQVQNAVNRANQEIELAVLKKTGEINE